MELSNIIPKTSPCLLIGDLNICSMANPNHEVFTALRLLGFQLLISEATHYNGGKIDQAWLRSRPNYKEVSSTMMYSPYFNAKDHDSILFSYYIPNTELG